MFRWLAFRNDVNISFILKVKVSILNFQLVNFQHLLVSKRLGFIVFSAETFLCHFFLFSLQSTKECRQSWYFLSFGFSVVNYICTYLLYFFEGKAVVLSIDLFLMVHQKSIRCISGQRCTFRGQALSKRNFCMV